MAEVTRRPPPPIIPPPDIIVLEMSQDEAQALRNLLFVTARVPHDLAKIAEFNTWRTASNPIERAFNGANIYPKMTA